ncbi:SDR family oxidoreductase [Pustulibacterium marinum]|nr:SDR family oxidoreductase [Pustulibacterium marinum]
MKVLIIGAHGKIGQIVSKKMSESSEYEPTAFIRKSEQIPFFENLNIPTVVASLEDSVETLSKDIKGYDAIVFTAGSGGKTGDDKTLEIDLDGAVKTMIAAEKTGITRYVMVSAAYADERSKWDATGIKPYYIAKHFADKTLKDSKLQYTIVRPVTLTDEPGEGTVGLKSIVDSLEKEISREDVADVILNSLKEPNTIRKVIEISAGDTPIEKVVKSA